MSYIHKLTKFGFHDISNINATNIILEFMDFILYSSGKGRNDLPEGKYNIYTEDDRKKFFSIVFKCIYS